MTLKRRTVLAGLASAVASGCVRGTTSTFPLGVASGDVTPNGALLWTHYTRRDPVQLKVWTENGDEGTAVARAVEPSDGYAVIEVEGLNPGTWHTFRFESESGELSPIGRFRTAIAPDAQERLVFGATCCIKRGHSYATLRHAASRTDLDAFIFLGDAVYNDGAVSLADFRDKWSDGVGHEDYVSLRGSTSMVALWDDHEVRNNWEGDAVDPTLLENARRAFLDHQPLRTNPDRPLRYWRSITWGKTAELFVLDGRSERMKSRGQYLSPEQVDWLVRGLDQSEAMFKLVLNTVPIGSFDSTFFAPFNDDNWQAYPEQREQILTALDATDRAFVVSGDFHFGCFGRTARTGPGSTTYEALVGPGANDPNPMPTYPRSDPWEFSTAVNNYTTFDLDPATGQAIVRFHAGSGRVLFERTLF